LQRTAFRRRSNRGAGGLIENTSIPGAGLFAEPGAESPDKEKHPMNMKWKHRATVPAGAMALVLTLAPRVGDRGRRAPTIVDLLKLRSILWNQK
jgi:hypothetical protein